METKVCNKCYKEKYIEDFTKDKSMKDGYKKHCKECNNLYRREKRDKISKKQNIKKGFKICTECGKELPITEEYFRVRKDIKCGFNSKCRECVKQVWKDNQIKGGEELKEKLKAKSQKYYKVNKEKILKDTKDYQEANREKCNKRHRERYIEVREYTLKRHKKYRNSHKEKYKIYSKKWQNENKDKVQVYGSRCDCKKKNPIISSTPNQWVKIKQDFNNKCAYCGRIEKLTIEHFIPISQEGELSTNNIIPACKSCNCSKNDRDFLTWYPKYKYYSKEREEFILNYLGYKEERQQLKLV